MLVAFYFVPISDDIIINLLLVVGDVESFFVEGFERVVQCAYYK